jgi:hypothetical protein
MSAETVRHLSIERLYELVERLGDGRGQLRKNARAGAVRDFGYFDAVRDGLWDACKKLRERKNHPKNERKSSILDPVQGYLLYRYTQCVGDGVPSPLPHRTALYQVRWQREIQHTQRERL